MYQELSEEADAALERGEFESAHSIYTSALKENEDSSEVKGKIALLNDYESLLVEISDFNWSAALDLANNIARSAEDMATLQKEVKQLLPKIEEEIEKEAQIIQDLKEVEKWVNEEEIEKAQSKLTELAGEIKSDSLKAKLADASNHVATKEKEIAEKERKKKVAEAKKKRQAAEAKEEAKQKD